MIKSNPFGCRDLIPDLSLLQDYLAYRNGLADNAARATYLTLEQLPYCLNSCYLALQELVQLQLRLVEKEGSVPKQRAIARVLNDDERDPLANKVDIFLESARRAQNALIPYISKSLSIQLPNSLSDLVKDLQKGKRSLPEPLQSEILGYWGAHGETLKAYRDLSQHYGLVASEGLLFLGLNGRPALHLVLPNNPSERKLERLSFKDPEILVYPYLIKEIRGLVAICFRVTDLLLPPNIERGHVATTTIFRNPHFLDGMRGYYLATQDQLSEAVQQRLEREIEEAKLIRESPDEAT